MIKEWFRSLPELAAIALFVAMVLQWVAIVEHLR
jgi:hypothetical protein